MFQQSLLTPWTRQHTQKNELTDLPEGQLYSLNSVRLKRAHFKLTVEALGVPTVVGAVETRQLVEDHLTTVGREPGLIQVIIQEKKRVTLSYI